MTYDFESEFDYLSSPSVTSSKPIPEFPSKKELESLEETLAKCLSSYRTPCKPLFYIAPIPCGGGKSRTVQAFIRDWKARGFEGGGSVIIMLGTYDEVKSYIAGCGLDKADYACFSKKSPYSRYGLGRSGAGRAKVLFITHEQLRRQIIGTDYVVALAGAEVTKLL